MKRLINFISGASGTIIEKKIIHEVILQFKATLNCDHGYS